MKNIFKILSLVIVACISINTTAQSLNGSYLNSAKQKLVISNHKDGVSFDFTIKWGVNDEWGCLSEVAGVAYLKGQQAFYNDDKQSAMESPLLIFSLEDSKISLDPSNYVSMDCLRYGDSNSSDYLEFKKNP